MPTTDLSLDKLPVMLTSGDTGYVELSKILWVDACEEKTKIYAVGEAKPMKCELCISELEKILSGKFFFRTHRSSIINLRHRIKFSKFDRKVHLTDNHIVTIAEKRIHDYQMLTDPAYRKKIHEFFSFRGPKRGVRLTIYRFRRY